MSQENVEGGVRKLDHLGSIPPLDPPSFGWEG
jgi:hypothetical protein